MFVIRVIDYFEMPGNILHLIVKNYDRMPLPTEEITRRGILTHSVEVRNCKIVTKQHLAWLQN